MASTNIQELEKLRPLGRLEQWSTARHHLGFYHNIGISVSYRASQNFNVKAQVYSALSAVILQHSILSAIPVGEDTQSPYFARLPEIDLDRTVTFVSRQTEFDGAERDVEVDELLEVQHNKDFKDDYGSLPVWRLIVVTSLTPGPGTEFVAAFIYHHALGDGLSGVAFHDSFYSALIGSKNDSMPSAIVTSPKSPLLTELDRLHDMPLPPPPLVVPNPPGSRPGLWLGSAIRAPLASRFQSLVFSKEITSALAKTCREHETTITAVLQVIIAVAIFQSIPEEKTELDCSVPVSIRRWLPGIDSTSMGNYLDGLMETYKRDDLKQFSWSEAQRSRATVQKYLAGGGEFLNVARIKLLSNIIEVLASQVGNERNYTFDVSNLGVLRDVADGQQDTWRRERAVFSRSAAVIQAVLSVGVVTGGDGCLVLGFVWQEGVVDDTIVKGVVEKTKIEIESLSRR